MLVITSSVSPNMFLNAPSVYSFKNRLDMQWSNEEIIYDYKAVAPAGRKICSPAGTQDLTIQAKACGREDTQVNLSNKCPQLQLSHLQ